MNSFGALAQALGVHPSRLVAIARQIASGALIAILAAASAHVLGVQQLLRVPDIALYLPAGIVGALIGATRLRPLIWIAVTPIALLCVLVAYTPLVSKLASPLIRSDPLPRHVDAIAVLSMGITADGLMRSETLDRLLTGVTLAEGGLAHALLVSREQRAFNGRMVSDSADQRSVLGLTDSTLEILFIDSVLTTRTEALRMLPQARLRGWSTIAVVTSPLHTRRACATFESVGFKVVCVPAASRAYALSAESIPEDRLREFRTWLYETFATATYRSNGWIR